MVGSRVAGIQLNRPFKFSLRALPVPFVEPQVKPQRGVCFAQRFVKLECVLRRLLHGRIGLSRRHKAPLAEHKVGIRNPDVSQSVIRIFADRLLEILESLVDVCEVTLVPIEAPAQVELMDLRVNFAGARQALLLIGSELYPNLAGDGPSDLPLKSQNIAKVALVALRPQMAVGARLD